MIELYLEKSDIIRNFLNLFSFSKKELEIIEIGIQKYIFLENPSVYELQCLINYIRIINGEIYYVKSYDEIYMLDDKINNKKIVILFILKQNS